MPLLIKNAVILGENGDKANCNVLVDNGVITEIGTVNTQGCDYIDAGGRYLLPGLIDMHCNICEPGYEYKEDINSISKSASKGGFTSITCQPNTDPVIDNKTIVSYILSKSSQCASVNIYFYGSMTKGCEGKEIAEIGEMTRMGIVAVSDGNISVADADLMRNILLYTKMFGIPVITYCEDKNLFGKGVMNKGTYSVQIGLSGIPREAEEVIVARNLILAANTGGRLHITHVSVKGSVDMIRKAKENGVNVTCDTCPHYFTLSDKAINNYNTFAKVRPPLRDEKDIEAIRKGIADGTIDVIASGHSPETIDSKKTVFDRATFGISSLETALSLSYTALVETNIITLKELVNKMAVNPSKILGLKNKAEIKKGADADLIIFDSGAQYRINASSFSSKAAYSPHDGAEVKGNVVYTITNGNIVYRS